MKKVIVNFSCILLISIVFLNYPMNAFADENHDEVFHDVTIKVSLTGSGFLANRDVTMYIDSYELCTIQCGEEYRGMFSLKEGTHIVRFYISNSKSVCYTLDVWDASDLYFSLKEQRFDIILEKCQLKKGCDETIAAKLEAKRIDAYCFSSVYQEDEVHAIRGSFKTFVFLDLVNEIKVTVTDYATSSHKPRASVEKIEVDTQGRIHNFFYFQGELYDSSSYGMVKHGNDLDYYVCYDKEGIKTDQFVLETVNDPLPLLLQKSGFFEKYPTPSSFLDSGKLYPVYGNS